MTRSAIAGVLGIAVGAAVSHAYLTHSSQQAAEAALISPVSSSVGQSDLRNPASYVSEGAGFADQAQLLAAAGRASFAELRSAFEEALALPPSSKREVLLTAFMRRLAEIDPERALEFLAGQRMDRATAQAVALAMLDAIGTTAETMAAVTSALPRLDRSFTAAALERLATKSPGEALELAAGIEVKRERTEALRAVASILAEDDPYAALAYAGTLPVEPGVIYQPARVVFEAEVLRHLARVSLLSAVEYIDQRPGANESIRAMSDLGRVVVEEAGRGDPLAALEVAKLLPEFAGGNIERLAVENLTRQDPTTATAYTDSLPVGPWRRELRDVVARVYAETDPEAALAWARSLDPEAPGVVASVLDGIARADPIRVLDLVVAGEVPLRSWGGGARTAGVDFRDLIRAAMGLGNSNDPVAEPRLPIAEIGNRLLDTEGPRGRDWVSDFVGEWSNVDPVAALEWVQQNGERVGDFAYSAIAGNLARRDLAAALALTDQLPAERREEWFARVVGSMADRDPLAAVDWVAGMRGDPRYEAAAARLVYSTSRSHPAEALQLFSTLSGARQIEVASGLASGWNRTDPTAATAWVRSLPAGELRDSALRGVVSGRRGTVWSSGGRWYGEPSDPPDPELLALFSSERVRQEVVVESVMGVAIRDEAAARALIDRYLTDPVQRRTAEQRIEQARNVGR